MELFNKDKPVIVQEFVPGKQITLCHIIANPGEVLYTKLGLDPQVDYSKSAIGVLTIIPYEGAVIAADISMKSSGADIGFVDRFTGTLIITGSVSSVESAFGKRASGCYCILGRSIRAPRSNSTVGSCAPIMAAIIRFGSILRMCGRPATIA